MCAAVATRAAVPRRPAESTAARERQRLREKAATRAEPSIKPKNVVLVTESPEHTGNIE